MRDSNRTLAPRERRAVIIGLGGIGSWIVQAICPFLNYLQEPWAILLVDGDEYEEKNRTRQAFDELGPKAEVQASWIARRFPRLKIQALAQYVSTDAVGDTLSISGVIQNGDTIFSCLDNHKSRKIIADHAATLRDVALISGGNDYQDGNVQFFIRRAGKDLTCRLEKYHPEIATPADKAPFELSCDELAASSPQLIFTNLTAATHMLNAFYALELKKTDWQKSEVYFDIVANATTPRIRK